MSKTTRDAIEIDLNGSIDKAIRKLQGLKKKYPGGELDFTSEMEYGERYEKLYLRFERDKEPVEIELDKWRAKRERYGVLASAAAAFEGEGAPYPRAEELAALKEELGCWTGRMCSLGIYDGEVLAQGFHGARRRDGTWVWRMIGFGDQEEQDRMAEAMW